MRACTPCGGKKLWQLKEIRVPLTKEITKSIVLNWYNNTSNGANAFLMTYVVVPCNLGVVND